MENLFGPREKSVKTVRVPIFDDMGSVKSTRPRVAVILGKETGTESIPVSVCNPLSGQVGMVD